MLVKSQKEAIEEIEHPTLIIGASGSGKVTILIEKAKKFIKTPPIIFVKSKENKEKLEERIKNAKIVQIKEFCKEFLEENIQKSKKGFKIIDKDQKRLFFYNYTSQERIQSVDMKYNKREVSEDLYLAISNLQKKSKTINQLSLEDFAPRLVKLDIIHALVSYIKFKEENNFLDEEDILFFTHKILKEKNYKESSHIFIPKAEELLELELDIIFSLTQKSKITIALDTTQEIKEKLHKIKKYFKNIKEIFLNKNFRSSQEIINFASNLAQNKAPKSHNSILKEEISTRTSWEVVENKELQKDLTTNHIKDILKEHPRATIGVLYFQPFKTDRLISQLKENSIQFRAAITKSLLKIPIIKEILTILKIISDPNSSNAEVFSYLKLQKLSDEAICYYTRKVSSRNNSLLKSLKANLCPTQDEENLTKSILSKLENFIELSSILSISELVEEIARRENLYDKIYISKKYEEFEYINQFILFVKSYEKNNSKSSLTDFLQILSYNPKITKTYQFGSKNSQVTILPICKSNFYEFDCVIIPNIQERRPSQNIFSTYYDISKTEFQKNYFNQIYKATSKARQQIYLISTKDNFPYQLRILSKKTPTKKSISLKPISPQSKIKQEIISNLNSYILSQEFTLAKKELSLLESLFSKNSLSSFLKVPKNKNFKQLKQQLKTQKKDLSPHINHNESIYSISKLQTFNQCPKKYLYTYVYRIPTKPKAYFDFGTSLHTVLEEFNFKQLKHLSEEISYAKLIKLLKEKWISKGYESKSQEEEYFKKGVEILRKFLEQQIKLLNQNHATILKEKNFTIELTGKDNKPKKIRGIIDRIDRVGDNLELLDYKTSKTMERDEQVLKNPQLHLYAKACKDLYKQYPKKLGLWYLLHNKIKTISFNRNTLQKLEQNLIETIDKIEKEEFKAKPSHFNCQFCDFNTICEDSVKK